MLVHTIDSEEDAVFFSDFIKNQKYGVSETQLVEVKPFNPAELEKIAIQLSEQLTEAGNSPDSMVLNYTAGTKPMSIAFYTVFKKAGARLLYVDTQQETCWWTENEEVFEKPLKVQLNIPELLLLRSGAILGHEQEGTVETLGALTNWIYAQKCKPGVRSSRLGTWLKSCVELQQLLTRSNRIAKIEGWEPELTYEQLNLEYDSKKPDRMDVAFDGMALPYRKKEFWLKYFTGGWFEHYVFQVLKSNGNYDDVRCNIRLKTSDENNPKLKNEIDIMAVKNYNTPQ